MFILQQWLLLGKQTTGEATFLYPIKMLLASQHRILNVLYCSTAKGVNNLSSHILPEWRQPICLFVSVPRQQQPDNLSAAPPCGTTFDASLCVYNITSTLNDRHFADTNLPQIHWELWPLRMVNTDKCQ